MHRIIKRVTPLEGTLNFEFLTNRYVQLNKRAIPDAVFIIFLPCLAYSGRDPLLFATLYFKFKLNIFCFMHVSKLSKKLHLSFV